MEKPKKKLKYKDFHIQLVYEKFEGVMSKYVKNKTVLNALFDDVIKRYSARGRHYHNMHHINGVTGMWESHKHLLKNPDEIFIAAIYHDIVYNAKRNDNETKSAIYFNKNIAPQLKITVEQTNLILKAILATIHSESSHILFKSEKDILYLLDFDLETLGTRHQSTYDWYKNGVRKEYKMYSDKQYSEGRKLVLESFLKRKKIYLTKEFKKIEKKARKNLQNEINSYIC